MGSSFTGNPYEWFAWFIFTLAKSFNINPQEILEMDLDLSLCMYNCMVEQAKKQAEK